jgi:hypothetical protein
MEGRSQPNGPGDVYTGEHTRAGPIGFQGKGQGCDPLYRSLMP